jgi:predicted nucleotidyltransferase
MGYMDGVKQKANSQWAAGHLRALSVKDRLAACPPFLQAIIRDATDKLGVETVWIFGSRAREDARPLSDYDIAFLFPTGHASAWARFTGDWVEKAQTLLPVDLVNFSSIDDDLQKRILKEGIVIYER